MLGLINKTNVISNLYIKVGLVFSSVINVGELIGKNI